jgi:hypothetical protein
MLHLFNGDIVGVKFDDQRLPNVLVAYMRCSGRTIVQASDHLDQ